MRNSRSIDPTSGPSVGIVSLICGIIWPVSLGLDIAFDRGSGQLLPTLANTISPFVLLLAPPIGIITGHFGERQARKNPQLHPPHWVPLTGLILCYLWLPCIALLVF